MFRYLMALAAGCACLAAAEPSFDARAMLALRRLAEPQLSPDGKTVAFTVSAVDFDRNTRSRQIWAVPVEGGEPRPLTREGHNERPRWSPDSKTIAFISSRGGSPQVWLMDAGGGNARQLTSLAGGASGVLFAGDGKNLVFSSEVYPDCADDACNKTRLEAEKNNPVQARIYTTLLYRHWNQWQSARRRHLFVVPLEGGQPKDLTPGSRDVPPFSLGGGDDYAVAPDGQELCFVMNADPELATSTNSDLYVVPIAGGEAQKITANPAADNTPVYSPDGRFIAYRAQVRAGYESDRWRLVVMERAGVRNITLTEGLDRSVGSLTWSPDSSRLFITVEDRGRTAVHMMPASGGGARVIISGASTVDDVQFSPDGRTMIYTEQTGARPPELYRASSSGGAAVPLTRLNAAQLERFSLSPFEELWVEGAERTRVHSLLLKPRGFDEKKKYPVLFLIHGGPQSAWRENFNWRWNPHVFAAAGFVVVLPNPRGSTGYGQRFTDEINADWGGKVYDDLMAVVDHVAALDYVDPDRMAAAGGSYGGYMANWILGHSNRFRALVSHAGVFDLRSMAGETEEPWFPIFEFRGLPWDNPEMYARWSPSYYVKDFKTPTLVIHGELDYRVPVGQGLQLFTALQLQKVPSKLLLFPDEGHWVQKPLNSVLWYQSFLDWISEWTRKPAK
jgi:dipeptidyl aminopeptidase/acylaminoacyl peptidase